MNVRRCERHIQELCVKNSGMPRAHFIKSSRATKTNLNWVDDEIAHGQGYSAALARFKPSIMEQQEA